MSVDLELWSVDRPNVADFGQGKAKGTLANVGAVHAGRGWQLVVEQPAALDADELPDIVAAGLPGIRYRTQLSLEPIGAPEAARKLLRRVAKELAKQSHGLIYDPQEDSITLPSGVKKIAPCGKRETVDTVRLAWWFGPDVLRTRGSFEQFVSLLKRHLPEALPKRYGTYEPPEFKLTERGEEHLLDFLMKEGRSVCGTILYPHRPVLGFSLALPEPWGVTDHGKHGFRANHFGIEADRDILMQPGWERQVRDFWKRMSVFLKPIYSDVRRLRGYEYHAGTLYSGPDTQADPCKTWFWRGFPATGGVAAVLGEPYIGSWPAFVDGAELHDGLAFRSADSWLGDEDVLEPIGGPLKATVDPNLGWKWSAYPDDWPFERPSFAKSAADVQFEALQDDHVGLP